MKMTISLPMPRIVNLSCPVGCGGYLVKEVALTPGLQLECKCPACKVVTLVRYGIDNGLKKL